MDPCALACMRMYCAYVDKLLITRATAPCPVSCLEGDELNQLREREGRDLSGPC